MLHIREFSDLHLERFYDLFDRTDGAFTKSELLRLIPSLPTDKKTVLIIAGDLAPVRTISRLGTFLELTVPRFQHVIYVMGNHEHYGSNLPDTFERVEMFLNEIKITRSKVTVAGNVPVKVKIKDVTFLLGTLWTDYANGDKETSELINKHIRDHVAIGDGFGSGISTQYLAKVFKETVAQFGEWMEGQDNDKTVVVTHHLPTYNAIHPMYLDPNDEDTLKVNAAFASDLNAFILKHQPAYWFFGHTHHPYRGTMGKTKLICNPHGYPIENNFTQGRFDTTTVYSL